MKKNVIFHFPGVVFANYVVQNPASLSLRKEHSKYGRNLK